MNSRKKSKQSSIASEEDKRKWPAAWGEPSKEERRRVPPPKWKIWIATRRVSLENAILLSLGYDPTFFRGESISHLLDNDPVKGRFQERLEMLRDCHTGPTIRLSDFASLAESEFKWGGLPGKLLSLAVQVEPSASSTTEMKAPAKWTSQKKAELLKEHTALKANGCRSPTKQLTNKYKISGTRMRELLNGARSLQSTL